MSNKLALIAAIAFASATAFAGDTDTKRTDTMDQTQYDQQRTGSQAITDQHSMDSQSRTQAFSKLDKDQSGDISKAEAATDYELTGKWMEVDSNKDGAIDVVEFSRFEPVNTDQTSGSQPSDSQMNDSQMNDAGTSDSQMDNATDKNDY